MAEISVEYEILLSAKVDTDTGEILGVYAFPQEFNVRKPLQVYTGGDHPDLPEYLPEGHPVYEAAVKLADHIQVWNSEHPIAYADRRSHPDYKRG